MMKQKQILRLVLGLAIASLLLAGWAGAAFTANLKATDIIEPDLLEALAAEGTPDFVVRLVEQADLSPAYGMDWDARGEFVYTTLRAVAERSQAGVKAYLDSRGLRYRSFIAGNELYVWSGDQTAANAVAELSEVASIRAAQTYDVGLMNSAETDSPEWNIADTGAVEFWEILRLWGQGIRVANIGTGVYPFHPALHPHYACGSNYGDPACWHDPSNVCGGSMCDNVGISTHSMGIMVGDDGGANQIGMAPGATWIACKGCETGCSTFALNACADWILAPGANPDNRPHVVDNSWSGPGCDAWYLAKIQAWRAAGIFPTFHAGNSGAGCSSLRSPGDYQESFASAGHDSSRNIAPFSSRGPSCFGHEPFTKPNISAPGVNIRSAWNDGGYHTASGTGMASPHSAGAVALLWSCSPAMVGQIDFTFEVLHATAAPGPAGNCGAPPDGEGNYTYGYGYLNVLAAGLELCGGWLPGTDDPFDFARYDCAWFDEGSGPSNYNQKVYCMGGRTGSGTESPDIWRYDPVADTWQDTGHNMVEDVSNHDANVLQDEGGWAIYVVSGFDVETVSNTTYVQRYYPATGVVGSVATDPWPLAVAGFVARPGGCITVQNRIYCFGGFEYETAPYFSDETWEYDPARPAGSRWQRITTANLHQPRGYIQFAVQNDVIYAMGGHYAYTVSDLVPSSMVEALDVSNLAAGWQLLSPMPVASAEGRGFGWAGKVYVAGGGDWPDESAEAMEYDIASNTWDLDFPNLITARRNHAGVLIPLCTRDPYDGLPGMWVFGGRIFSDDPPFGSPEYFPLRCFQVYLPLAAKNY